MVRIVIIEPHPLLRLGLAGLMTQLTATDLVLLGAHSDARINLLIQAVRHAHAPKRVVLMSEPPVPPASWVDLPAIVVNYVSTCSSAEAILASIQAELPRKPALRSPFGAGQHTHGHAKPAVAAVAHVKDLKLEVDEARMLGLSPRQYEVLALLAQGHSIKAICRQLEISMATATVPHVKLARSLT